MHASLSSKNALNSILQYVVFAVSTVTTVVEKQNTSKKPNHPLSTSTLTNCTHDYCTTYRFSLDDRKEGIDGNMLLPSCSQHLVFMERLVGRSFVADG